MQSQLVETVLREIREEILNFAARQSVNLSPWFIENENRLAVVAQMMGQVAARSSGASPSLLAEQTLGTMRTVIAARLPQEADWFGRNQGLLQRIAEGLAERLLARPSEATLNGHPKTGQSSTPQNRPVARRAGRVVFSLKPPGQARTSSAGFGSSAARTAARARGAAGGPRAH